MGLLDCVSNFLNGPGLPSPYACKQMTIEQKEQLKAENNQLKGYVQYTEGDLRSILTALDSDATACGLLSIFTNPALAKNENGKALPLNEKERIDLLARKMAEFTVRTKFVNDHAALPADSQEVRTAIALLSEEQKAVLINTLAARLAEKIGAKLKEENPNKGTQTLKEKNNALINLFFPTPGLKEDFTTWCPTDEDPYLRRAILDSPFPSPVLPLTPEELGLMARGGTARLDDEKQKEQMRAEYAQLLGYVQYTEGDLRSILTALKSDLHTCSLLSIFTNPALVKNENNKTVSLNETERIELLARKTAEFTVRTKFAKDHPAQPADSREIRNSLAQLTEERRIFLINTLTARIADRIRAKLKEATPAKGVPTPEDKDKVLVDLFFPTAGLKDDYANWCPDDKDPYLRRAVIDRPFPSPVVLPITIEELAYIARGGTFRRDDLIGGYRGYQQPGPNYDNTGTRYYETLPAYTGGRRNNQNQAPYINGRRNGLTTPTPQIPGM